MIVCISHRDLIGLLVLSLCCTIPSAHAQVPPEMIRVEPGVFVQGSPKEEVGRFDNERPFAAALPYVVWVGSTEVTQGQWREHVPKNPSFFSRCGAACPVDSVNWYEALAYTNRRSAAEGLVSCYQLDDCTGTLGGICGTESSRLASCQGSYQCKIVNHSMASCDGYRLLSESEWEYVARAGVEESNYGVTDKKAPIEIARHSANAVVIKSGLTCLKDKSTCAPIRVGTYLPSPWGHYDFHGNLREWVWDGFAKYPTGSRTDPRQDAGMERVIRGSSFRSAPHEIRAALRSRLAPQFKNAEVGFRLARRTVAALPAKKATPPAVEPKQNSNPLTPQGHTPSPVPPGRKIRLKVPTPPI